ncbi:MAG TPA: hypothetical protein VG323_20870 [Thermoanaerobaculia bacterium]|nr:hypothetical protein [Thermoanaerobaculia bacterium]
MRRLSTVVVLSMVLSGCQYTSKIQYRASHGPAPAMTVEDLEKRNDVDSGSSAKQCAELLLRNRSVEKFTAPNGEVFTIGVIELSDDGTLKDPQQSKVVFEEMQRVARGGATASANSPGAVIVTFVHGWHHRAKTCDENISCFRRTMEGLVMRKGDRQNQGPVFGLYIGWRGESIRNSPYSALTFYARKSTAHYVGSRGGKDILLELDKTQRELDTEVRNATGGQHFVNLVTVGHSFGGAFVYSAFESLRSPENAANAAPACNGVKPVRQGIGDLVVLVNPAFEAWRYRYFADDLTKPGTYASDQHPVLLTVASEADDAVGKAFPAGRTLWLLWHPNAWAHGSAQVHGLGHYVPYTTNTLVFEGSGETPKTAEVLTDPKQIAACGLENEIKSDLVRAQCDCSYPVYSKGLATMAPAAVAHLEPAASNAPYLVASAPGNLISGHNDIYNPNFVVFLIGFINKSLQGPGMPKPDVPPGPCKTASLLR